MSDHQDPFVRSREFCTTREAAARLGVALRTIQLWVDTGILEAWKTEGGHRRISVASVERKMSDRDASRDPTGAPIVSGEKSNRPLRILVVEDDNVLLKLYRIRIASWNLPVVVTTASNACEALILIGREQPDLMFSDLRMPGIDGFQMIRTLANSSFREGLEIVVVSGMSPEQVHELGGLPNGVRLLPKPVPFNELRQLTEALISRQVALGEL
jgi:excisionase family DNA binding protein